MLTIILSWFGYGAINRLSGADDTIFDSVRIPLVMLLSGLLALSLYPIGYMIENSLYLELLAGFTFPIIGYRLFRAKGPTLAWLGGQPLKNIPDTGINHPIINKFLKRFHNLDINQIGSLTRENQTRLGNIGGAYRGCFYLIPLCILMSFFSIVSLLFLPLGLLYGKIHTFFGKEGKQELMFVEKSEWATGLLIIAPSIIVPILAYNNGIGALWQ